MFLLLALALLSTISYADAAKYTAQTGYCRGGPQADERVHSIMKKVASNSECEASCASTSTCVGYAYRSRDTYCYNYGSMGRISGWTYIEAPRKTVRGGSGASGVTCYFIQSWILSKNGQSCTDACKEESSSLKCDEEKFLAQMKVHTSSKDVMNKVMQNLEPPKSCGTAESRAANNPPIPLFDMNNGRRQCNINGANRQISTIDCDATNGQPDKYRLCFCTPDIPESSSWVTKGRHGGDPRCDNDGKDCSTKFEVRTELHGVRCCGDASSTGKFVKNKGCSVYAASRGMGQQYCHTAVSYSKAASVCQGAGARLCTIQELKNNCAASTGCGLDFITVWSSDADPNLDHSPITTIPTLKPSARSTPPRHYAEPRFHDRSKHPCREPYGGCSSIHALNANVYAISCCKTTRDNHWFQKANTPRCQNVWSASGQGLKHKNRCSRGTWYEAHHVCEENGARLCSKQELSAGCAQSTGCQFDGRLNWSMD